MEAIVIFASTVVEITVRVTSLYFACFYIGIHDVFTSA